LIDPPTFFQMVDWLPGNRPVFSDPHSLSWHSLEWRLQAEARFQNSRVWIRYSAILRKSRIYAAYYKSGPRQVFTNE
jgi:hypothetical protein